MLRDKFPKADIDCVEYLKINADILKSKGFDVKHMDFLEVEPEPIYDWVVMNPPFSVEGDKKAYMTHLYHAFKFLKPYGKALCVMPTGWLHQEDARTKEFKDFLSLRMFCDSLYMYEKGAFKDAGTMVETCMVTLSNEEINIDHFVSKFNMVATGSYGQDLWRKQHKEKGDNEYIDYVVSKLWEHSPSDTLPKKYTGAYLDELKTMEF